VSQDVTTIDELLDAARSGLRRLTPAAAYAAMQRDAVLVDIRMEGQRERGGLVPGARYVERNVLEWRCDPACAYRDPALARRDLHLILICEEGYQSSLAAATLQRFGLEHATDVVGGFQAWLAEGLPVISGRGVAGAGAPAGLQNR
jgi:rhodanese-related sulfurtransferase